MSKRTWIAVLGLGFGFVLGFAWLSKPESLRSQLEHAGIHPKEINTGSNEGVYDVSNADRAKIADILRNSGYKKVTNIGIDATGHKYSNSRRFFYFWEKKQNVNLGSLQGLFTEFNPDI